MIKPIVRDVFVLGGKSVVADKTDIAVADDLNDTLRSNIHRCVGMAANMIGVRKRIIVFVDNGMIKEMFNPEIIKKSMPYETEEGCLSLDGVRKTTRYRFITVKWSDRDGNIHKTNHSDYTAQIIQHEIDHCNGIII